MGTKRVGWARIRSLINENQNQLHPVLKLDAGAAGTQGPTKIIVGKNGDHTGTSADPFAESATKLYDFGTLLYYGSRVYRYAGIGGTGVTAGKTLQHRALHHANHRDLVCAVTAAGESTVTVTLGATAATLDQYAEGYIMINLDPGQGQMWKVRGNAAADALATCAFTLYDKVTTALTAVSRADLITNVYDDLIVAPTTHTGAVVGVTVIDMTADYYGWVQVSGPCSVLQIGTVVLGQNVVRSAVTAGGVAPATSDVLTYLGEVMSVNDTTDNCAVWLNLP